MPSLRVRLPTGALDLAALRAELDVPGEFSPEALAEARAAAAAPRLPERDRTDLPLVTLDPPGSRDLDQALHLARTGSGYRVSYAIADVAAFVTAGSALDSELFARGVTLYTPDARVPLHPPVLGEDAASLLPQVVRPALLWELDLDRDGALVRTRLQRAQVRSRARLDYPQVQAELDGGTAGPGLQLLREVGRLREQRARERGAVDLPTPDQEVELDSGGRPRLTWRAPLPVEGWNAQLSLLTGAAAARLMLDAGIGLLRTLPPPEPEAVQQLRRSALALGVSWPAGRSYGAVVSALDPAVPAHAAVLALATRLLRGAGYTAFDGAPPDQPLHSGVALPYAHCTAPLRRLADRHVGQVCLAVAAGSPVPAQVRAELPRLPEVMAGATRRAAALERAVVDAAEAVVLASRVGERFPAVVVAAGTVQLQDPPVRARAEGELPLGKRVTVELVAADPGERSVLLRRV